MTYNSICVQIKAEYAKNKTMFVKNPYGMRRQGLNLHICDPSVIAEEENQYEIVNVKSHSSQIWLMILGHWA